MLISHQYKFIFIHIYKTGGTSIREALRKTHCFPYENLYYTLLRKLKLLPTSSIDHVYAKDLKRDIPKFFNAYFKFCFIRNPWDLEVSLYYFMKKCGPKHFQYDIIKNFSFEQYLEWRINEDLHQQAEYILDDNDGILVDFIGKLENIDEDFNKVCTKIGYNAKLKVLNKNLQRTEKDYRTMYNDYTRKLITKNYNKDIELGGYVF